MSDPGIPADDQTGSSYQRGQPAKIKLTGNYVIRTEASRLSHCKAAPTFRGGSGDHDAVSGNGQAARYLCKAADWPAASFSFGARMHNHRMTYHR